MVMLLWTSEYGTVKIECSIEMGKNKTLGVLIILLFNGATEALFFLLFIYATIYVSKIENVLSQQTF